MEGKKRGFTLIELLLVVTIISLLAVAVFVALNPAKRLQDTKNARRTSDVDTILSAIHQSIVDTKGRLPTGLSLGMAERQIGTGVAGCAIATGGCAVVGDASCVNLVTPLAAYLKAMPIDPDGGPTYTADLTGYSVEVDTNGIVTVKACGSEGTAEIYSSR
jgi:prepilin-type N-terminal cleavage/methylation domain-containing protein